LLPVRTVRGMRVRTLSFIAAVGALLLASAGPADAAFAPDSSFDGDGAVVFGNSGADMGLGVASAGGATYVAYSDLGGHVNVARLTQAGGLDGTWGGGDGLVQTSLIAGSPRVDVLVLASGKVLVAGGGAPFGLGLGVVRLTAAGVPDTTFSGDGMAVRNATNVGTGRYLARDGSGRIYVAGNREQVHGPGDMESDFAVARFTANGGRDNTFSTDSIAYVHHRYVDLLSDLAVDASGRVLLMGETRQTLNALQGGVGLVARLRANGSPDPNFSGDGKMTFGFGGTSTVLGLGGGVDGSNRVVFGVTNFAGQMGAVRVTGGGALDTTYSGDGRAFAPFASVQSRDGANRVGTSMVFTGWGTDGQLWVGRLTATGTADTAFGPNGELLFDATGNDFDEAMAAAAGPAGSIVTAGYTSGASTQVLVTRLNPAP
jgi:uncharacterized delta-60 repeat protein